MGRVSKNVIPDNLIGWHASTMLGSASLRALVRAREEEATLVSQSPRCFVSTPPLFALERMKSMCDLLLPLTALELGKGAHFS